MRRAQQVRPRRARAAVLAAAWLAGAALADAQWTRFLPRALESGAALELFGSSEEDDTGGGDRERRWRDEFVQEKLRLHTRGYVYHPRFLLYQLELGGALKQERFRATPRGPLASESWRTASGYDYRAKLFLLPEHAYNLELFALRWEPLFKERSAVEHDSVSTSHGADFRYRRKPWFFHARYSDNTLESEDAESGVERFGADGEHFRLFANGNQTSLRASLAPARFTSSAGLDGRSTEESLAHDLRLGPLSLASHLTRTWLEQEDAASRFENEQRAWSERLTAALPAGFRAHLAYRRNEGDSTATDRRDGSVTTREHLDRDLEAALVHRLYDSLQTTYSHRRGERSSRAGESDSRSDTLGLTYQKRIPRGRLLVGFGGADSQVENDGRSEVANEPHAGVAVPGSLLLARPNVELASLALYLRSPIAPFEVVPLVVGEHWIATEVNDTIELFVFSLPPRFVLPGSFDFFVSYALAGGAFELDTRSVHHSASLELLDRLLTPYYSYTRTESAVRSGLYPGTGLDSATLTAGIRSERGPLRARVEYQDVDWDVSPYESWRGELQYVGTPRPRTTLSGTASVARRRYSEGLATFAAEPAARDEEIRSLALHFQQQLLDRRLILGFGGSLSSNESVVDSEAYSIDSSLVWHVGRLDLSTGATYYSAESSAPGIATNRRSHHLFFLRLRREMF